MNGDCRAIPFDVYTKIPQTFERALAIDAFGKIVDRSYAFGYGGNHRQTMTDGFISRYRRLSAQSLGWLDFQTIHSRRLARSLTLHKPRVTKGGNELETTAAFRADDSEPARRNAGCTL